MSTIIRRHADAYKCVILSRRTLLSNAGKPRRLTRSVRRVLVHRTDAMSVGHAETSDRLSSCFPLAQPLTNTLPLDALDTHNDHLTDDPSSKARNTRCNGHSRNLPTLSWELDAFDTKVQICTMPAHCAIQRREHRSSRTLPALALGFVQGCLSRNRTDPRLTPRQKPPMAPAIHHAVRMGLLS
jgi:hypothetical protein